MRLVRLYCDDDGTSHLEEVEVAMAPDLYAPPAPPLDLSAALGASRVLFCRMPAGWFGDWHPTPVRQLFLALSGTLEVAVSDGQVRQIHSGEAVLVEDLLPPGHTTRVVGQEPVLGAFIHLADEA